MNEKYSSIFDIVGPVMIGPSSSHTAGAVLLGQEASKLLETRPQKITIDYYESFAKTHAGHGTDFAIVAGVLKMAMYDPHLPESLELAKQLGIELEINELKSPSPIDHPNTATITLTSGRKKVALCGCSIGGGKIEVKRLMFGNHQLELLGSLPVLLFSCSSESLLLVLGELTENDVVITAQNFCKLNENKNLYALSLQKTPAGDLTNSILKYCDNLVCL